MPASEIIADGGVSLSVAVTVKWQISYLVIGIFVIFIIYSD